MKNPYKKQVGGKHYKHLEIQPTYLAMEVGLNWCDANILKYIMREKNNKLEDLKKVLHYIDLAMYHGYSYMFVKEKFHKLFIKYINQFSGFTHNAYQVFFLEDYLSLKEVVREEISKIENIII